jgi:succinate dehydrogenase / fumarate reductase membrane anchor subunit
MNYVKIRSPLAKAKNLGVSGTGAHHWLHQRLTSCVMAVLVPWIFYFIYSIAGKEMSVVLEHLRAPYNIVPIMLFLITTFYHASLGMRIVIEDYVHNLFARYFLIIVMQIFSVVTVVSGIVALFSLMMML